MKELWEITVGNLLSEVAKRYPDDVAVKYNDRPYMRTWKEFNEEVEQIAKGFLAMGIGKGDHVAIWATNVPAVSYTHLACGINMKRIIR